MTARQLRDYLNTLSDTQLEYPLALFTGPESEHRYDVADAEVSEADEDEEGVIVLLHDNFDEVE